MLTGIGLSLAALLVCLLVIETLLRWQHQRDHARLALTVSEHEVCTRPARHPQLIYELRPNKCGFNAQGFTGPDYPLDKQPGVFRIVMIGDSVAMGQGVRRNETLGTLLENELNHLPVDGIDAVEVIVMAVSGYSTSQEIVLLEDRAFEYSPDLLVWSYVMNDPAHPVFHNANGAMGEYYYRPDIHLVDFVRRKLFEIREQNLRQECGNEFHLLLHCAYWPEVERNVRHIGSMAQAQGVPALFLLHPIFPREGGYDAYVLEGLHARLRSLAAGAGMQPVDLLAIYRSSAPADLAQQTPDGLDPWHPNAAANRIAAGYLRAVLRKGDYLQPAEG